jgi:hypothetical protein
MSRRLLIRDRGVIIATFQSNLLLPLSTLMMKDLMFSK